MPSFRYGSTRRPPIRTVVPDRPLLFPSLVVDIQVLKRHRAVDVEEGAPSGAVLEGAQPDRDGRQAAANRGYERLIRRRESLAARYAAISFSLITRLARALADPRYRPPSRDSVELNPEDMVNSFREKHRFYDSSRRRDGLIASRARSAAIWNQLARAGSLCCRTSG